MKFDSNYYALYFQDEWRVKPSFTLTYGLRYEYQEHDQPAVTNPLYPSTGQIPQDKNNFAPRVGFAWDINGNGKSVVRGGIGMFYDNTPTLLDANALLTNGITVVRYSVRLSLQPRPVPDLAQCLGRSERRRQCRQTRHLRLRLGLRKPRDPALFARL